MSFLPSFPSLPSPSHPSSILLNYHPHPLVTLIRSITCNYMFPLFPLSPLLVCFLFSTLIPFCHSFIHRKTTRKIQTLLSKGHPPSFSYYSSWSLSFSCSFSALLQPHQCLDYPISHLECYNNVQLNVKHSNTLGQTDTHTVSNTELHKITELHG